MVGLKVRLDHCANKTSLHTAYVPGSPNSRVLLGGATRNSLGVSTRKNASELPVSRDYWSPALCAALGASLPGGPPSSGAVIPSLPYGWSLLSRPGQRRGRACCQRGRGRGTDWEGRRGEGWGMRQMGPEAGWSQLPSSDNLKCFF